MAGFLTNGSGNLYSTTTNANFGGTVYELSPSGQGFWTQTILYSSPGSPNGLQGGVIFDPFGDLYGAYSQGGSIGGERCLCSALTMVITGATCRSTTAPAIRGKDRSPR